MTAAGRPAGESRCSSTGTRPSASRGVARHPKTSCSRTGEHRLVAGVVDAQARPAGHREALGRERVEPARVGPRQEPAQRLHDVDAAQVPGAADAGEVRSQPVLEVRQAARRRTRRATAHRARGAGTPSAAAGSWPRRSSAAGPARRAPARRAAPPRRAPAAGRRAGTDVSSIAPSRRTRRATTAPSGPRDDLVLAQQRRRGLGGQVEVDRCGGPDGGVPAAGATVGVGDREPRQPGQPGARRQHRSRPGRHQVRRPAGTQPGDAVGMRERHDEPDGEVVAEVLGRRAGRDRGSQPAHLGLPRSGLRSPAAQAHAAPRPGRRPGRARRRRAARPPRPRGGPRRARRRRAAPRASRGSAGIADTARPRAVGCPSASTAPSAASVACATVIAAAGGRSSSARPTPSGLPQHASSSANAVRSAVRISGSGCATRRAWSCADQHRYTAPGPSRPARPARCSADARLTPTVTRPASPRRWSVRGSRESPASTTSRTPGTVSDDSATAVETTTRRRGPVASARSCTCAGRRPCRGRTSIPSSPPSRRATPSTSPAPGTKTRTSPVRSVQGAPDGRRDVVEERRGHPALVGPGGARGRGAPDRRRPGTGHPGPRRPARARCRRAAPRSARPRPSRTSPPRRGRRAGGPGRRPAGPG